MTARILGIEYYLPAHIETNECLRVKNPNWNVDDIYKKTGIISRHIAASDETASDLGFIAAIKLLKRLDVNIHEIDYLIFCTQSPDYLLPSSACILQHRLGLSKNIGAFDFNLGCSGYIYGLNIAKSMILSKTAHQVLLIVADTYSKYIHPRDRTVSMLFGDGAAATLIGPGKDCSGSRIGEFVLGTDGSGAEKLIVPSGACRIPRTSRTDEEITDSDGCTRSANNLFMDGPSVFNFAISVVPHLVKTLLMKAGLSLDQIDWYIYHQANKFMLDHLAKCSKIPSQKMVINLETIGNTVSASIPIALQMQVEKGQILPGDKLVLVGFGVGYSWGACEILW
jgi:3-oxoacyl-[acyl-carrier-protein] synthase-3